MKKLIAGILPFLTCFNVHAQAIRAPRIVNIVNFIRLLEPRDPKITEDVLYQTVVSQVALMKQYRLRGTFLLQYDALMDPRYQKLLKGLPRDRFEIGAWWEIPQPLVEDAGLKWRGRYPWDWRANIGFSTGYTPRERDLLTDTYMRHFKKIFGYYPKSVASWFIDAHTLNYMYQKYHIVASANCKDQYGTDGYTLWGGYWNQAYYPSKGNAYMPAQHAVNQIPVPIFRMLGSDPIRQYDNGLDNARQGVVTLEPVYPYAGGDSTWVSWYFKQFVRGAAGAFAYTQAGQENSFTWPAMAKGLGIQFPLIARLRDQKLVKVQTLEESGRWFKKHFGVTPATAVTALEDSLPAKYRQSVWFDSRFYRTNVFWENDRLRVRDIHLFDENLASQYEQHPATSNDCSFFTLPVVDGYLWSTRDSLAGLRVEAMLKGRPTELRGDGPPIVSDETPGRLTIQWRLANVKGTLIMRLTEKNIDIFISNNQHLEWYLKFAAAVGKKLPFISISKREIHANFAGTNYSIKAVTGYFSSNDSGPGYRIMADGKRVTLGFNTSDSGEKQGRQGK